MGARLDTALRRALAPWTGSTEPLVVLFSGGIDSGVLAWELRARRGASLWTIGTSGAKDMAAAESAAARIGLPWAARTVSADEVRAMDRALAEDLQGASPLRRSIFVALALAIDRAPGTTVLCGQGADELFLGYAHFRGLSSDEATARADADLDRLTRVDWPLSQRLAHRWGRTLVAPFLDPGFVDAARSIPIDVRRPDPVPKAWWREWARGRGVPSEIVDRPKRALQYGTGIDAALRGLVRG